MRDALFINGRWIPPARGGAFPVIDPATAKTIHSAPAGTGEDIDNAVKAARAAFDDGPWPKMTGAERGKYLRAISKAILARKHELARLEVLDNGKPLPEADWDIADAAGCFEFYAELAEEFDSSSSEQISLPDERFSTCVVREPIGVVGAIIPWNYPLLMAAWKVAPALAAGCTVILKPSELTPLTALELAAIAADVGLPPGVLNVVTGLGKEAGQALGDHTQVDKLAFTGSVATGSKIFAAAAKDIKRVSLELGAILVDVPVASEAWREEIFGPVVAIRSFKEEAEAIRLANDSRYGLAAAVMSEDTGRAERVAAAMRAGIVWINCSQPTFTQAPWGGYKQSGIGRELGRWGFDSYLETKQITRHHSDQPWGWYLK